MQLSEWLRLTKTRRSKFARQIGASPGYVTQICSGACWPGREMASAIYRETEGQVRPEDFFRPPKDGASCTPE